MPNTVSKRLPTKQKYGKWYADWRDEQGKRHAKSFDSKRAARKFQDEDAEGGRCKKSTAPGNITVIARAWAQAAQHNSPNRRVAQ